MENQVSSKNVILNYGLYYGIVSILLSLSLYAMNMHLEGGTINIVFAIAVTLTFPILGIYKFKKDNSDFITWGQSVKIGIGIILIGVLITIIYNHIFTTFIEPDFMTLLMEKQVVAWEELNMTEEQIEASKSMMETFSSPGITSAIGIVAAAFFGFVISAIAGAIMKRTEEDQY